MPNSFPEEGDIKEYASRLRALIEMASDGIITIDTKGVIESTNRAASDLFGYQAEEMLGQNVRMLMTSPDRERHDSYMDRYHKTGEARIIGIGREVMGRTKSGKEFPLRLAVSQVQLGDRIIYTGILHDISEIKKAQSTVLRLNQELEQKVLERTEELKLTIEKLVNVNQVLQTEMEQRKQAEKELTKALRKEKELGELKSRFVSMASHEFKTPLSTVLSSVELIEMYQASDQQDKRDKHIGRIRTSVRQLTEILNDFLSLSRLEQGSMEVNIQKVQLPSVIAASVEAVQGQLKSAQRVELLLDKAPEYIQSDPKLLQASLVNLLSNAAKYSQEGQTIKIRSEQEGDVYHIEVRDQGIGIPEGEQEHLFTKFFRASNVENIKGTGLGLNIVNQYVDLLGGEISLESSENQGTSIILTFPIS